MANKAPQPDRKTTLIAGSVVFIVFGVYMTLTRGWPVYITAIFVAAGIAYLVFAYGKEGRDDKKAADLNGKIIDESYFNSSEWREEYLRYSASHAPEAVDPQGMAADLKKRYHAMTNWLLGGFGVLMAAGSAYLLISGYGRLYIGVLGILLGLALAWLGFETLLARPVKRLYTDISDISPVERSYESGRLFTHKSGGICVGREYTVIYNNRNVWAVQNSDITSVDRKIVRVKNYSDGIYRGDEFHHYVLINADKEYTSELNEYDTETAVDELCRILNMSRGIELDEKIDDNVTSPHGSNF